MLKAIVAIFLCSTAISGSAPAQPNETPPLPSRPAGEPSRPPMPNFPPNAGPQPGRPFDPAGAGAPVMPGAPTMMPGGAGAQGMPSMPGMPDMRSAPGVPPGVGARPMPPPVNQPTEQVPGQNTAADATSLVSVLDSTAPFVQAIDFLLMVFCGFYCLRRNKTAKSVALRLMSLACFVSAIILLGFFLAASYHGHPLVPVAAGVRQFSYVAARILAPFELLLFAVAIVLMARREP